MARVTSLLMGFLLAAVVSASAMAETLRVDTSKPHNQPPYPDAAQVNGEQGAVELAVLVRPSGKIGNVRVAKSSGFPDLDNAAVEGVLGWRYIPPLDGDSTWTTVRIVYQLPKPPAAAPAPAKTP
jgi:TonB family protein